MIKVDQTLFGVGKGNCLPACISTITGYPLVQIPNFCALYPGPEWYDRFVPWCRPLGLAPWTVAMTGEVPEFVAHGFQDIPWIACGHTSRGLHCCVYIGGSLYHDPNPCREGLQDVIDGTFFLSREIRLTA
jgi:hypothetical protein